MKHLKFIFIAVVALTQGVACSNKKFNSAAKGPTPDALQVYSCNSKASNSATRIVLESELAIAKLDELDFTSRVKNFVSAAIDPQTLGEVSGTRSGYYPMTINLYAPLKEIKATDEGSDDSQADQQIKAQKKPSTFVLDKEAAYIEFVINDSLVGSYDQYGERIAAYRVRIDKMEAGTWDTSKPGTWTFADEFGTVTIDWTVNSETSWYGTVSFANKKVVSLDEPAQGVLGIVNVNPCTLQKLPTTP